MLYNDFYHEANRSIKKIREPRQKCRGENLYCGYVVLSLLFLFRPDPSGRALLGARTVEG